MSFADPPAVAAWQHRDARSGFEVVFIDGPRVEGYATAVEEGDIWAVEYVVVLDADWATRSVRVRARTATGAHELELERNADGDWRVNGATAPELDGCLDVDLEVSAFTNALPVHRLDLAVGEGADVPAAYVRARDLGVEVLEQRYLRLPNDGDHPRFHYSSRSFQFEAELVYDASGLVIDYPGIATRTA
jgi:uncharacterized protein